MEIKKTEEVDWGLITATPTQSYEDWGPINTNDETIPKSAENWGFLLPDFNYIQIGGQHYPNREVTFSLGETSLSRQTVGFTGTATFLLSEDLDVAAAIDYESSGKSGIATHNAGIFISGELWLSQAPQHTVFGEEGEFTISGTGKESITPVIPEGSGSLFTIGGAVEATVKEYLVGSYQSLTGVANVNFAPHVTGIGTGTFSQGREENQTYARKINIPDDELGGILTFSGQDIYEKNTDSYNESSIFYGSVNEDYGSITKEDVSRGFGLNVLGIGLSSVDSLDNSALTFDSSTSSQTYDEAVGGNGVLPSFDKNQQYDINFSNNSTSENYGVLGFSSVGGPAYDQYLYPHYTGFQQQEINQGYEDSGFITEPPTTESQFPFGKIVFPQISESRTQFIPSWIGSGSLIVSGTGIERVAVASSTTSLFDFVSGAEERYIAQTPEGTVLFEVSGITTYSRTRDFVGSGSVTLESGVGIVTYTRVLNPPASGITTFSGASIERSSFDPPEGTYLHIFGGGYTDLSAAFATQSEKATLRLSGELNHPQIDFTPHYGIERNIGIETGLTFLPGGTGGEYGDPGIVTTRFVPKYPTSGIISLNGKAIGRTNAPILTDGTIYILGIGTEANGQIGDDGIGDLNGVEFGAKERFIPATEFGAGSLLFDFQTTGAEARPLSVFGYYGDDRDPGTSGITTISGVGITKPVQVFGYYGDDKDPGTSGTFTFSNTPLVHPFVDFTPSIGIGVAVLYQTSGTALESVTRGNYTTQGILQGTCRS